MLMREQLAWAAGFFDGEGNTFLKYTKEYGHLRITVAQCNFEILKKWNMITGNYGKIYKLRKKKEHHSQSWALQIERHLHCQIVIAQLWEFLSEPKREQIIEALKEFNRTRPAHLQFWDKEKLRNWQIQQLSIVEENK